MEKQRLLGKTPEPLTFGMSLEKVIKVLHLSQNLLLNSIVIGYHEEIAMHTYTSNQKALHLRVI